MNVGDIITDYNGNKYKVITAGDKPNTPFILNNVVNNDIVWGDIHLRKWGGGEINYSTDEVCIGTWIDGKPLYEKSYTVMSPSDINTSQDIITLNSMINLKNMSGLMDTSSGTKLIINHYVSGTDFVSCWRTSVTGNLRMSVGSTSYTSQNCYITIQYTKTTD